MLHSRSFAATVSLGIVLVVALATIAADLLIRGSVRDMERKSLDSGLDLVARALQRELAGLDAAVLELAEAWGSEEGARDLAAREFPKLGISQLSALGPSPGSPGPRGYALPLASPVPEALLSALAGNPGWEEGTSGFFRAPGGLLAFAARPLPGGGFLVAARRADAPFVARLRDATLQNLELAPLGASARPREREIAARLARGGGREYRVDTAWKEAEASELLRDAEGEPAAVATIRQERVVRAQAYRSLRLLVAANAAGALLAAFLVRLMLAFSRRQFQKRADAERRSQVLIETAPDAIAALGADGRIRFANAKAAELLGLSGAERLVGVEAASLAPEGWAEPLRAHVAAVAASGSGGAELRLSRADGRVVPVEVRSSVAPDPLEGDWAVISFVRDVSERVEREKRILALTEKLALIARLSQRTGSLIAREDYADLVVDSSLVLVPGSMPSLWIAGPGAGQAEPGAGLVCLRGAEPGSRPLEGGSVVEAFRSGRAVFRERESGDCALPLSAGGRVLGVFGLALPGRGLLDDADREALAVFAEQLAAGFENGRLYDETLERLRQLEALRTIDRAISSSADIGYVLSIILEQARTRLGADAADVLLLDRGSGALILGARAGFGTEALAHTRLRLGEGLAGRVAAERRSLVLRSLSESPEAFAASPAFRLEGFAAYAGAPLSAKGELLGVLELHKRSLLDATPQWESFFEAIAGQAAIALDNAELLAGLQRANAELSSSYEATIEGWAEALELRDRETEGHSRRVTEASLELASALGIRGEALVSLRHGALLHDIGKMGVPDAILLKPGPLTEEEFEVMKRHTTIGRDLLAKLSFLGDAVDIPYAHHEKWDGSGYPRALAGEGIPIAARLFSIVDVWDALRSDRPYRKGWTEERTLLHIEGLAGSQFDPRIVPVFAAQRRSRSAS